MASQLTFRGKVRALRIARRKELRERGVVPARITRVYRVDLTKMSVPPWARRQAIPGLSISDEHVWLRRFAAKKLAEAEHSIGGRALLTETEYRRCPVCERPLLGEDAEMRRRLNESCVTGRMLPCGSDCYERARAHKKRRK